MRLLRLCTVWTFAGLVLAACSTSRGPAPVESRAVGKPGAVAIQRAGALPTPTPSVPVPDGFYRVRKGDTLIGISLDHGVAWRDLAAWNEIDKPNQIEVDQVLRVKPPASSRAASSSAEKPQGQTAAARPLPGPVAQPAQPSTKALSPQASATATAPTAPTAPSPQSLTPAARPVPESIGLSWPSPGQVITQFAEPGYKGIAIAGAEGDPILAAGDGRVVYSGSGLRGYGNLVIVKHDGDFLTAYAHNKTILVAEGQTVKRGQKIAELGKTDSDIPKLHFEVRRSGKPVDPLKYLAQR